MPTEPEGRLRRLLTDLSPRLRPGTFVYRAGGEAAESPLLRFQEEEGETLVVPATTGTGARLRLITLEVESRLDDVGLLAAVSAELAAAEISCNVISALHHDHLLVPEEQAEKAVAVLQALQRRQRHRPEPTPAPEGG